MKILLPFVFILFTTTANFAQTTETFEDTVDFSIPQYDKLCSIMGGDSIRYNNGIKATGLFKDYYPNGQLKHRGYYENGSIVTVFTNFFENGRIERDFKPKSDIKGTLYVYYPNGTLRSKVDWIKGESKKWEDFYPNGKPEFAEEFNGSFTHYQYMHSFYENGNPRTLFELTDKKSRIYISKEFYENGQVKEMGNKIQNLVLNDYQMEGKWSYFSEDGKLTLEEEYVHGQLISDKQY